MEWDKQGVFGDKDMPEIDNLKVLAMGQWISPEFDLSGAFEVLDEINSAYINIFVRPLGSLEVVIYVSYDQGETWDQATDNIIQNAEKLNDNPHIMFRVIIISYISRLDKDRSPEVHNISVILSDKDYKEWSTEFPIQLEWSDPE